MELDRAEPTRLIRDGQQKNSSWIQRFSLFVCPSVRPSRPDRTGLVCVSCPSVSQPDRLVLMLVLSNACLSIPDRTACCSAVQFSSLCLLEVPTGRTGYGQSVGQSASSTTSCSVWTISGLLAACLLDPGVGWEPIIMLFRI